MSVKRTERRKAKQSEYQDEGSGEFHGCSRGNNETRVRSDIAVSHARGVERQAGGAVLVEQNDATSSLSASGKKVNRLLRGKIRGAIGVPKGVGGGFGHDYAHDGFPVAGGRSAAGFGIGVTAGADEGRVTDTAGKFATDTACGGGRE